MVVGGRELIDTLWNVNIYATLIAEPFPGINRYIMECKFFCMERSKARYNELIDTLWNVNSTGMLEFGLDYVN